MGCWRGLLGWRTWGGLVGDAAGKDAAEGDDTREGLGTLEGGGQGDAAALGEAADHDPLAAAAKRRGGSRGLSLPWMIEFGFLRHLGKAVRPIPSPPLPICLRITLEGVSRRSRGRLSLSSTWERRHRFRPE